METSRRVVGVVGVVAVLVGCSSGSGSRDAEEGEGPDPAEAVCEVTAMARDTILGPDGVSFSDVVQEPTRTTRNAGVSSMLYLSRHRVGDPLVGKLGPYEPAIAYLDDRGRAWEPEFADVAEMPKRTDQVVESARRLDEDLAGGLCDG